MLTIGIFSALGLLLLALKAGGKKAIGHDIFVDIMITGTLMIAFYGTYSGMTAAMVGGLTASIVLFLMCKRNYLGLICLCLNLFGKTKNLSGVSTISIGENSG